MLSLLYTLKPTASSIIRMVLAAGLALALLAGIVPFSTFSSAQQTCTMSCCAGKPPHPQGSCSAAFSDDHHADTDGDNTAEPHAHTGAMQANDAAPEIIEATSHCGTTESSSEQKTTPSRRVSSPATTSIIAHALTRPCSPECAAAAVSTFSQGRRPRVVAALPANHKPRPPTPGSLVEHISNLQTSPKVFCRQSRPRAPPLILHHLPA